MNYYLIQKESDMEPQRKAPSTIAIYSIRSKSSFAAICYKAIHESWVSMLSEDIYNVSYDPSVSWQDRKNAQNHELFAEHPEWIWILENVEGIFDYVTFKINAEKSLGIIDNNGILPEYAGKGYETDTSNLENLGHFLDK